MGQDDFVLFGIPAVIGPLLAWAMFGRVERVVKSRIRDQTAAGLLTVGAVSAMFFAPAVVVGTVLRIRASAHGPLFTVNQKLPEYEYLPAGPDATAGTVRGKVVVVNTGAEVGNVCSGLPLDDDCPSFVPGQISPVHWRIPLSLRAVGPGDVGTVVLLEWSSIREGTYESGHAGYRSVCEVSVIDLPTLQLVAKTRLLGDSPQGSQSAPTRTGFRDRWGRAPTDAIVDYVVALPRASGAE